jgi:hypothetical protein
VTGEAAVFDENVLGAAGLEAVAVVVEAEWDADTLEEPTFPFGSAQAWDTLPSASVPWALEVPSDALLPTEQPVVAPSKA